MLDEAAMVHVASLVAHSGRRIVCASINEEVQRPDGPPIATARIECDDGLVLEGVMRWPSSDWEWTVKPPVRSEGGGTLPA